MSTRMKRVTVYFTEAEYGAMKAIAEEEEVSVSAVLRGKLGLAYKRRGAPVGNCNRRVQINVGQNMERRDREK